MTMKFVILMDLVRWRKKSHLDPPLDVAGTCIGAEGNHGNVRRGRIIALTQLMLGRLISIWIRAG